jgi:DNA-binding HxlR family transcriptional regulator
VPIEELSGSEHGVRAGTQALSLLGAPRNCLILRSLADGPKRQVELRRDAGFPAQTTLRGQLRALEDAGVIARNMRERFPAVLVYELTGAGRSLLSVVDALESWLEAAPDGSYEIGSDACKAAVKTLVGSWNSTLLHVLAEDARSLTELDSTIAVLSYPSLERRLGEMRLAGQVEPLPGGPQGRPYEVSDWMRRSVGPLVAAARWERSHGTVESAPIARADAVAAFLLTVPLLRLSDDLSGACALAVEFSERGRNPLAGVAVEVENGAIESCAGPACSESATSVRGSVAAWLRAVIDGDPDKLRATGDRRLGLALVDGLHGLLFAP